MTAAQESIATPVVAASTAVDIAAIDALIEESRAKWNVPGLSVAIVKDGKVVLETALEPNRAQHNVELEAGTYTVRIFRAGIFVKSLELAVQKDGWVFRYGC